MNAPPRATNPNRVRMSDRRADLTARLPFIKAEALASANALFDVIGFERRSNRRFNRIEGHYVVRVLRSDIEGLPTEAVLTLELSDRREALGRLVRTLRPGQVIADVRLLKTPLDDRPGEFFYEFAEEREDGEIVRLVDGDDDSMPDSA